MNREDQPTGSWIRRYDQAAIAGLLVVAVVAAGIWIYRSGALEWVDLDRAPRKNVVFQVNINTAKWPELTLLPGIGETRARRIIEFREEHGPFRTPEDLLHIHGIGPKTVEKLEPFLVFSTAKVESE